MKKEYFNNLFEALIKKGPEIILIILMLIIGNRSTLYAENLNQLDSLTTLYKEAPNDSSRIVYALELAGILMATEPVISIQYGEEVLNLLSTIKMKKSLPDSVYYKLKGSCLQRLAIAYSYVGDNQKSLNVKMDNLKVAQLTGNREAERSILGNLGVAYQDQGMIEEAMVYYRKAFSMAQESNNTYGMAMSLGNMGTAIGSYAPDSTLNYYQRSLELMKREDMHDREGAMGWMMHNIGSWYENDENIDSAFYYYFKSLNIRESIDHRLGQFLIHRDIAELFASIGDTIKAMDHINKSIRIGEENGFSTSLNQSYKLRSMLREKLGDFRGALADHQRYLLLRDSIVNDNNTKQLIQQTMQYEYGRKHLADSLAYEKELAVRALDKKIMEERLKRSRNIYLFTGLGIFVFALGLWSRMNYIRKSKAALQKEKDISENLLLNILPEEVAEELKLKGYTDAKEFDQATILFTDFKGFTSMSETMTASDLVHEIDTCFKAFDDIIEKYGLEKIKTIGDAYMAAGGLPVVDSCPPANVVKAGLEMQDFIIQRHEKHFELGLPAFEMRVGIHTGPVIAGVVGLKKFQYDIWGDTVNTASRIESNGEVGKVNISQSTYVIIRDDAYFTFESRGKIVAKGKGEMEMWFVNSNQK